MSSRSPDAAKRQEYATIVADPPWHYEQFQPSQWKGREWRLPKPYPSLTVEEIRSLPVGDLAAKDARLFLWTTNRYLRESFSVIEAWGFTYRQAIVWRKTGNVSPFPGHIAPQHSEYLLVAARGKPGRLGVFSSSVIEARKPPGHGGKGGRHSEKPDVFLAEIERVSKGPYLELFARSKRPGWAAWGDEVDSDVEMVV